MKRGQIIGIALVVIFTLAVLLVGGQFAGGYFLLKKLGLDPMSVKFFTLMEYYKAYGKDTGQVGKLIKLAMAIAFSPLGMVAVMGFILLLTRKTLIDRLYGDARFATMMEVRNASMFLPEKNILQWDKNTNFKWPPVLLGRLKGGYLVDGSQEYTTLSALPGGGKGVSFVIPNLLFYPHNVVTLDPKLENFRITSGYREKVLGQKVFLFCPDNVPQHRKEWGDAYGAPDFPAETTHCWNPLDYISDNPRRSLTDIKSITELLIDVPDGDNAGFFLDARSALDGILLYLIETPEQERTLYNAACINGTPIGFQNWAKAEVANRRKKGRPLSADCERLLMGYANESEKKFSTTKGIVSQALEPFTDPYSRAATSKSDFSFYDLRAKKMSVYIGIAPSNIPKFGRMLKVFFSQAIACNVGVLPDEGPKDADGKPILKYQCLFLIDEFVALGRMEIIRASAGFTRAYNVRYAIIFQNKSQVVEHYGQGGANSLLETFHNEIVFATESVEESEEYSKRLGNITIKHREHSRTKAKGGGSTTTSVRREQRALMLPQEVMRLPYEEQLFFKKGGRILPLRLKKIVWYKEPVFMERANMPLPEIPPMDFADSQIAV